MAGAGGVRVSVAFDDGALEPTPTWTDVTALSPNLVAGYDLSRGREFELDATDTGSYSVSVKDPTGILDVTNSSSPLFGTIEPDLQLLIELWNPVAAEWSTRFRGWISDFDYDLDPSQRMNFLRISCYDIFALLTSIEMQPGEFGMTPPVGQANTIFFDNQTFQDRINAALTDALGAAAAAAFSVVFTGNVNLLEHVLSAGQNPMDVIQVACDAEFPGVSNVYPDRLGRLAAHGRLAKFDPEGTAASAGADAWDWHHWKLGDDATIRSTPATYAHLRPPFSWNRGRSRVINSALAYPKDIKADQPGVLAGQYVKDAVSIGIRGYKSWSKENLLTESGILTGNNGNDECKAFAQYYVNNYATPRNRITALTTASVRPTHATAAQTWEMLCKADIADRVDVTVGNPGAGGFNLEPFSVEGVRETAVPHDGEIAYVTMSLDVSPIAFFTGDLAGLDGA